MSQKALVRAVALISVSALSACGSHTKASMDGSKLIQPNPDSPVFQEPNKQAPALPDQSKQPVKLEPAPIKQAPIQEPAKQEPVQQEPTKQEPIQVPVQQEPVQQEPVQKQTQVEPKISQPDASQQQSQDAKQVQTQEQKNAQSKNQDVCQEPKQQQNQQQKNQQQQNQQQAKHGGKHGHDVMGSGSPYAPITNIDVCIGAEGSYQCTGMIGADGQTHASGLAFGDGEGDVNSMNIRVTAMSIPGRTPITNLNLCVNAEGRENGCTGYVTIVDGVLFSSPVVRGDGYGDVQSVGVSVQAFATPGALPMNRINLCLNVEGQETCTGAISADEQPHESPLIQGDGKRDVFNVGIGFSALTR